MFMKEAFVIETFTAERVTTEQLFIYTAPPKEAPEKLPSIISSNDPCMLQKVELTFDNEAFNASNRDWTLHFIPSREDNVSVVIEPSVSFNGLVILNTDGGITNESFSGDTFKLSNVPVVGCGYTTRFFVKKVILLCITTHFFYIYDRSPLILLAN